MAGMSDNPLVGDYTKGISKGPEYLQKLEQRVRREKGDMKAVARDLQMDIMRKMPLLVAFIAMPGGLDRFGGAILAERTVVAHCPVVTPVVKKKTKTVATLNSFSDLRQWRDSVKVVA